MQRWVGAAGGHQTKPACLRPNAEHVAPWGHRRLAQRVRPQPRADLRRPPRRCDAIAHSAQHQRRRMAPSAPRQAMPNQQQRMGGDAGAARQCCTRAARLRRLHSHAGDGHGAASSNSHGAQHRRGDRVDLWWTTTERMCCCTGWRQPAAPHTKCKSSGSWTSPAPAARTTLLAYADSRCDASRRAGHDDNYRADMGWPQSSNRCRRHGTAIAWPTAPTHGQQCDRHSVAGGRR